MTVPPPEPPQQPSWQQPPQPPQGQPWQQQPAAGYGSPAYPQYQQPRPTAGKATTVLVLGIVGIATFFTFCGLGVFAAIAALVIAPGARREIEASGGQLEGEGKIRTGVILSWVTVGLTVLALLVVAAVLGLAVASSDSAPDVGGARFDLRPSAG